MKRGIPFTEVKFCTHREISNIATIATIVSTHINVKKDSFWENAAVDFLNCVILHLLYSHHKEDRPLPELIDITHFLYAFTPYNMKSFASDIPDINKSIDILLKGMWDYPHISVEEFLSDYNPFQEVYGEYVKDFHEINAVLGCRVKTLNELKQIIREHENVDFGLDADGYTKGFNYIHAGRGHHIKTLNDLTKIIINYGAGVLVPVTYEEINPFRILLTHPKVAEYASNMINSADQTRRAIISTARVCLAQIKQSEKKHGIEIN